MKTHKNHATNPNGHPANKNGTGIDQIVTISHKVMIYFAILSLVMMLSACGAGEEIQEEHTKQSGAVNESETLTAYENACSLVSSGDYEEALAIFESLENYEDSDRHADGIRAIEVANELQTKETANYFNLTLVGMEVSCVYYPEDYTFLEVWEIPEDGLYGVLSEIASVTSGEEVSYDEAGLKRLAEGLYFDYFFPNYPGVICMLEMRDKANSKVVQGSFSGYDDVPSSNRLGMASIEDIQQYANQRDYVVQDGTLVEYLGKDSIIEIPEGVSAIAEYVFSYNEDIEAVYMPSTLKYISEGAFYCCEHLSEIYLQEGLERIGQLAFYGTDISTIEIPKTVNKICQDDGNYSPFDFCLELEVIYFEGTMDQWKEMNVRIGNGTRQNTTVHCEDGELSPELQHATYYEDDFTGIFLDETNGVNIVISALSDDSTGEVSYYMTYVELNSNRKFGNIPVSLENPIHIGQNYVSVGFDANIARSSQEDSSDNYADYGGYILMAYLEDGTYRYCPVIYDYKEGFEDIDIMKEAEYCLERVDAVG